MQKYQIHTSPFLRTQNLFYEIENFPEKPIRKSFWHLTIFLLVLHWKGWKYVVPFHPNVISIKIIFYIFLIMAIKILGFEGNSGRKYKIRQLNSDNGEIGYNESLWFPFDCNLICGIGPVWALYCVLLITIFYLDQLPSSTVIRSILRWRSGMVWLSD